MTYINAIKYLTSLPFEESDGNKLTVAERMRVACDILNINPNRLKYIHICGDVGKDSIGRMLASILGCASYKVGRYSHPNLNDLRSCIISDKKVISCNDLAETVTKIAKAYKSTFPGETPLCTEIMTLAAIMYFISIDCDMVIFERDCSRSDPANISDASILSIITPFIDREIPRERFSGLIQKRTTETVSSPQHKDIYNAISDACASCGCRLTVPIYSDMEIQSISLFKTFFKYRGLSCSVRSFSPCQTVNAITAIEAAMSLNRIGTSIDEKAIENGLSAATLDGKCETVSLEPTAIIAEISKPCHAETLLASLAQVKDHLSERISVYIDGSTDIDVRNFSESLTAYGIRHSEPLTISLPELKSIKINTEPDSASIFVGNSEFISEIKHLILNDPRI